VTSSIYSNVRQATKLNFSYGACCHEHHTGEQILAV